MAFLAIWNTWIAEYCCLSNSMNYHRILHEKMIFFKKNYDFFQFGTDLQGNI